MTRKTTKLHGCVVGAGAVGALFVQALAKAGWEMTTLARGDTLSAIRNNGLQIDSERIDVVATDDPRQIGQQDYVILALKAPAMPQAAPRLAPLIGPNTVIVSTMNGVPWWYFHAFGEGLAGTRLESVDPGGAIAAAMPSSQALGCVVHLSSINAGPGVINRGKGNRLIVGDPSGPLDEKAMTLVNALKEGGFEVETTTEIQREIWSKLWGNMNMNPISALTGSTGDRILKDPLTNQLVRRMMVEHLWIGQKIGIDLGMTIDERFALTRKLGAFKTSMLQDLESGRPLEIDALLASVIEIGALVGVPTPYCDTVLGLIRQKAANLGLYRYALPKR
ncbi:MAG: 2-dehydropantoate 2-reductase [Betaproteobacteria bacterium]